MPKTKNQVGLNAGFSKFSIKDDYMTPKQVAQDMIEFFKPTGSVLEPCMGGGVFTNLLPTAQWCEITRNRDFFDWKDKVDWIITNPPYSKFSSFLRHGMEVADNIVFLAMTAKPFYSTGLLRDIYQWGGIETMRFYGSGSKLNFPLGYHISAIYFKRNYHGPINISFSNLFESVKPS